MQAQVCHDPIFIKRARADSSLILAYMFDYINMENVWLWVQKRARGWGKEKKDLCPWEKQYVCYDPICGEFYVFLWYIHTKKIYTLKSVRIKKCIHSKKCLKRMHQNVNVPNVPKRTKMLMIPFLGW